MIHIQGDGGHARVVRELLRDRSHILAMSPEHAIIAVGDNADRKREAERLKHMRFVAAAHLRAVISTSATYGEGTVIMAGAVVQAGARIGKHCIVNTGATVDHDCWLADFVHVAPGAHLCGGVTVGEGALIGVGVGIEPGVTIPAWAVVKRESYVVTLRGYEAV